MAAYVLRFCNNIKKNSPKLVNSLSLEEIEKVEETLIKIMHSEWPSEIYLGELIRSPKVASRRKRISPGEIVIVELKNPNRINWPLNQVIELFPYKDGVERMVKLRLASGEIMRPRQRIYPLVLSASDHLSEDHQGTDTAAPNPGPYCS
ncbi:integrase catalytic domain-containing protein [Nephila pilipes]|uniref:Integrase catalytic domain-containing protein n=1 Tax=Nephila pilipes TaxID=299642 RepID=A0A8X6Q9A7_NEPPI|nr:integrase catalytic domain-containing protein [Nephila pilipes]